jgi:hypothetical protein
MMALAKSTDVVFWPTCHEIERPLKVTVKCSGITSVHIRSMLKNKCELLNQSFTVCWEREIVHAHNANWNGAVFIVYVIDMLCNSKHA